jgi:hypothetical protein
MDQPSRTANRVTELLTDWSNGNAAALDELMPLVYDDLRRLARRYMPAKVLATRCKLPVW